MSKLVDRVKGAADKVEMRAYRSALAATSKSDPFGRAAISGGVAASRGFAKAKQLRMGLEMRIESTAREKRRKLAAASREFREHMRRLEAEQKVSGRR